MERVDASRNLLAAHGKLYPERSRESMATHAGRMPSFSIDVIVGRAVLQKLGSAGRPGRLSLTERSRSSNPLCRPANRRRARAVKLSSYGRRLRYLINHVVRA